MQAEHPKAHDDPNSYSYLAQGSSLAGSKRSHEATASLFDDVRRKRVAPTYDNIMAERLEHSFANGIDDATLHAILSSFGNSSNVEPEVQSTSLYPSLDSHQQQAPLASTHSNQGKFSLPEAFKQTDLAELNAFLLQVGANAARTDTNEQVNQHHQSSNTNSSSHNNVDLSGFDFQAALAASGLTNIAGFDQNLLQMSQPDLSSMGDTSGSSSHGGDAWNRPIAQLPQRAMHNSYGSNMSFDNIRQSRVPSYVPQLGAKDMISPMYRHVEALTRAAPDVERQVSAPTMSKSKGAEDEDMSEAASSHEEDDQSSSSSSPLATKPKDSSPGLNLYPRMSMNDSSRRMPMPVSLERSSSDGSSSIRSTIPSITSILQDRPSGQKQWREHQARASFSSSSPSPPPQSPSVNSSEPLYPSLRQESPSPSTGSSGVALNDPERRKALLEHSSDTLAPLRLRATTDEDEEDKMDVATTPTLTSSRQLKPEDGDETRSDGTGSDETANGKQQQQKPSPPTIIRSHLPKISDLLNEVDSSAPPKGAGGRRIMDMDI
ncbi:hypothetical protein L7F22_009274 [Adiantum nelumboides]|nr:hypothetical protein [Adiantum nelumboides]